MALETILSRDGFELDWENSADYLHLVCRHPQLQAPLGISLDVQERQDFLDLVRSAQRASGHPLEHRLRLGALPARPARLRLSLDPGPQLVLEAIQAGRQLFEVRLDARSAVRALVHLLIQAPEGSSQVFQGRLSGRDGARLRIGELWGSWSGLHSHVLGPSGEWLPLEELAPDQLVQAWLGPSGVWERLSLDPGAPSGPERLVERGLFEQAESALSVMDGNPAKLELARAYLAVQRGPLLEALPHLHAAREGSAELGEADENLLLELESYLLCQHGPEKTSQIAQNMQKLVARQITRDRWAARRALSNWRAYLDLIYQEEVPPLPLQVWQGWLSQLPSPVETVTLTFARPASWAAPSREPASPAPERQPLPPERSQLVPLAAIALALLLGFWWRWKHPVQWGPSPTPSPVSGSAK